MSRLTYAASRLKDLSFLRPAKAEAPKGTERLGQASQPRPEGCLIWVTAENAVEAGAILSLVKELSFLREGPFHCLVSTETNDPLVPKVAREALHQLVPVETPGSVERFLNHWAPDVGISIGVVDRPKLFAAAADRGIPLFHVAAERSERRRFPAYLGEFRACLAASAAEMRVLRDQFADRDVTIEITGPLTDTTHALSCNEAECDELAKLLGGRPVWLAADVHPEEIDIVEEAHRRAFRAAHRLLLILVPRVLEDAADIRRNFDTKGWRTALRSEGDEPDPEVQVYIADTEDELGMWYRLAPTSFVGGTLCKAGDVSDPFDPAALGSAVLHGPHLGEAPARFFNLMAMNGSMRVSTGEELGEAVQTLLASDKAASLAQTGWAVTTESASVVERLAELVDAALDRDGEI
ncbi:MAG: hypothetical protein HKN18_18190 [Silicimonas sp.]|nr:hypothetical protein [Silicimonas sp.]